jgi:hypothetical protein
MYTFIKRGWKGNIGKAKKESGDLNYERSG